MLYITLILMYVMEEVWEYWMEIDIMILYSNTPWKGTLPKTIHGSDQFSCDWSLVKGQVIHAPENNGVSLHAKVQGMTRKQRPFFPLNIYS